MQIAIQRISGGATIRCLRNFSVLSIYDCMRRAMQDECNALELELKHHEKGFAELVSEELEQRFMRFEEVTLAAVQKMVGHHQRP